MAEDLGENWPTFKKEEEDENSENIGEINSNEPTFSKLDEDEEEEDLSDDEISIEDKIEESKSKQESKNNESKISEDTNDEYDSDEDEDENNIDYLQKLEQEVNTDYLAAYHPESIAHNYEEVKRLATVVRNKNGIIVDEFHKTNPFLTKYELTRVLGQRTKQINSGSQSFVDIPPNILDGYIIAEKELLEKKLPFIIQRPLPGGGQEYWHLKDLEILGH